MSSIARPPLSSSGPASESRAAPVLSVLSTPSNPSPEIRSETNNRSPSPPPQTRDRWTRAGIGIRNKQQGRSRSGDGPIRRNVCVCAESVDCCPSQFNCWPHFCCPPLPKPPKNTGSPLPPIAGSFFTGQEEGQCEWPALSLNSLG